MLASSQLLGARKYSVSYYISHRIYESCMEEKGRGCLRLQRAPKALDPHVEATDSFNTVLNSLRDSNYKQAWELSNVSQTEVTFCK